MRGAFRLPVLAVIGIAAAAAVGVVRFVGSSPPEQGLEGVMASAALGGVLAGPSLIVLVAHRQAPRLSIWAGAALFVVSLISIATWPLLILAAAYVVAGADARPTGIRTPIAGAGIAACTVAALAVLFLNEDPRSWTRPDESGSVSDVVSYLEASISLGLTGLAVAIGAAFARNRTAPA